MRSLTQYYLALMSIAILGTYSNATSDTPQSILTNILGLPTQVPTDNYATIVFDMSIQVGSGTQSFSPTLKSLSAPISNGSGTGQLLYNTVSISYTNNSISALTTVSNSSGNTITVSEIGLIETIYTNNNNGIYSTNNFISSYDTFNSPISIPAGGSASFQIVITFSG